MKTILLAIDDDEQHARTAAEAIVSLADLPSNLEVVVLNVFEEFEVRDESSAVSSEDIYDESARPESVETVIDILESNDISATFRREHGDPAKTILDVGKEIDADSFALGGRKRTPVGKAIFGSVTQSVLLSADRPVIVVPSE